MSKPTQLSQADVQTAARNAWRCKSFHGPSYQGSQITVERGQAGGATTWHVKWHGSVINDQLSPVYDQPISERSADDLKSTRMNSLQDAFERADKFIDAMVHEVLRDCRVLVSKHVKADDFGVSSSFGDGGKMILSIYVKNPEDMDNSDLRKELEILPAEITFLHAGASEEGPDRESER